MHNLIVEFPNAFPDYKELTQDFDASIKKHTLNRSEHGVYDFQEARLVDIPISSQTPWSNRFIDVIEPFIKEYLKATGLPSYAFPKDYGFESARVKEYLKNEGQFDAHVDVGDYATARRFLVMMVYLNNVEDGGETFFPNHNIKIIPEPGKLVMFPAGFTHPHAGLMPISGRKLICGSYLHYL